MEGGREGGRVDMYENEQVKQARKVRKRLNFVFLFLLHVTVYHKTHDVIIWFWEIVEAYPTELKLRLLQVCMM